MSSLLGAHDIFPKRSFESVIEGYILSLESYVTADSYLLRKKYLILLYLTKSFSPICYDIQS